jgi:ABC-type nickel/cobalt efflux system permease component RcnA
VPLRAVLAVALFLACLAQLAANPFMGSGASAAKGDSRAIAPVRANGANPDLVSRQATLRDTLGDAFYSWKEGSSGSELRAILVVAFLYGILHALGPGHRKTVVFSLYLARNAPAWEPAGTGALLALLHAGAAVVILFGLRGVSGAISGRADNIGLYMEGFAYLLLAMVALYLVVKAAVDLLRGSPRSASGTASLGTILLTGIYPCPGAILVLVLSLSLDIVGIGVLAVVSMSLGMAIPIVAAGYLAWFGRTGLFRALKRREERLARVSAAFELFGYSFLLAFALYMVAPFSLSLLRAIG